MKPKSTLAALMAVLMLLAFQPAFAITAATTQTATSIEVQKQNLKKELKIQKKFETFKQLAKRGSGDLSKGLYIVLAIFGLGFVGMGILDDWKGNDWVIALILSVLFWLPGLIYALIKMKKYYN
jgi:uncharacterized membrane protein YqaE (UPF0057 family)